MKIDLTEGVCVRLAELFPFPNRQAQKIRDSVDAKDREGICFGRVPDVRLWFWGEASKDGVEITRVWPDNPFPE